MYNSPKNAVCQALEDGCLLAKFAYNYLMQQKYCYFNGKITTLNKVKISPYDIGFLRGYGVFDVMRTVNGKPFLLDAHWRRFRNSARELNLKIPISKINYTKSVNKLVKLNNFDKSTIRTILTGGVSGNGFTYCGQETFLILVEKFQALPKEIFTKGAGVITCEYARHIPVAKVCNYVEAIRQQKRKAKNQALEIIYAQNGKALEASTSNFFIVKNGKIITTKDGILAGTTRNLVIALASAAGYAIKERDILEKEIYSADEAFLTATLKTIVPVVKINGKKIGTGRPGKITQELMEIFRSFMKNY